MEFDYNYYIGMASSMFSKPAKPSTGIKKPLGPKSALQTPKPDPNKDGAEKEDKNSMQSNSDKKLVETDKEGGKAAGAKGIKKPKIVPKVGLTGKGKPMKPKPLGGRANSGGFIQNI